MKTINLLDGQPLRKGEHLVNLYSVSVGSQWVAGHPRYIGNPRLSRKAPHLVPEKGRRQQYDDLKWAEQSAALFPGAEIEHTITRAFYL